MNNEQCPANVDKNIIITKRVLWGVHLEKRFFLFMFAGQIYIRKT